VQKNSPEYCKVAALQVGVYLAVELHVIMPSDISLKVCLNAPLASIPAFGNLYRGFDDVRTCDDGLRKVVYRL